MSCYFCKIFTNFFPKNQIKNRLDKNTNSITSRRVAGSSPFKKIITIPRYMKGIKASIILFIDVLSLVFSLLVLLAIVIKIATPMSSMVTVDNSVLMFIFSILLVIKIYLLIGELSHHISKTANKKTGGKL